jgi:Fe-S cluster biosynthesis and repair protein YggX
MREVSIRNTVQINCDLAVCEGKSPQCESGRLVTFTRRRCTMPDMADCDPTPTATQPPAGNKSGRIVHCVKFQKDLPGLDALPWPGELGQRIYENVSAQAWKMWEERMKMILNEYRLMPWQKEAQELIGRHMEDFFFGQGAALPPGYVPQQTK